MSLDAAALPKATAMMCMPKASYIASRIEAIHEEQFNMRGAMKR
tara:strand:- start:637 stop:768 length:132 start_codon:yes stop_codon:yes gene_type:complete